jgi:hypothetical protein
MKRFARFIAVAVAAMTVASGFATNVYAQSPNAQMQQLVKSLQLTPDDNALREKIARAAATMNPRLAVPEEAHRYFVRAQSLLKIAKLPSDYDLVIQNYKKALLVAPWWSDAYYYLANTLELTQQYPDAIEAFKLSVLADPRGPGARDAKDKMYAVEAEQEKALADKAIADKLKADKDAAAAKEQADAAAAAARAQAEQAAAAAKLAQAKQLVEAYRGTWYGSKCHVGDNINAMNRGCTDKERGGVHWYVFTLPGGPIPLSFTVPGDGTVTVNSYASWAGCTEVVGIPQGSSFANIRW